MKSDSKSVTVSLSQLLAAKVQMLLDSEQSVEVYKIMQDETPTPPINSVYLQYKSIHRKTKKRIAKEKLQCRRIRRKIFCLLDEIVAFTKETMIYPLPSGDCIAKERPILDIQVFDYGIEHDDLFSKAELNKDINVFQTEINRLSDIHIRSRIGVEWGFETEETVEVDRTFGYATYKTYHYVKTFGVEVIIKLPSEILVNGRQLSLTELNNVNFKKVLSDAFVSPIPIRKFSSSDLEKCRREVARRTFLERIWYGNQPDIFETT